MSGSSDDDKIDPDDVALFVKTVGAVKALARQNRVNPHHQRRPPLFNTTVAIPEIPDTFSDFAPDVSPTTYLRNGLSHADLRKLKRGVWPIQGTLDLHGHNIDAARRMLQVFLHEAAQHRMRSVLVIHGKGINSQSGEAVLRKLARHWLTQHPAVLAYSDATPKNGGSGAAVVLLKVTDR